jgi:hypothetical protein
MVDVTGKPDMVAADLEQALRIMWQRWCKGLPQVAIDASDKQSDHRIQRISS